MDDVRRKGVVTQSKYFKPTTSKVRAIRYRSERCGIELNVSDDDLSSLLHQACHYCGLAPRWPEVHGIDRKDNDRGYVYGNCLPCCSMCNYMKGGFNYVVFLRRCREIASLHVGV